MMLEDCVFCRIVKGELPCLKVIENDGIIAILDTNSVAEGHCLIIPKKHVHFWHDLDDTETAALFNTAKIVAKKMKKVFKLDFVCVFIRGGRVKHLHAVLFPSHEGDELSGFPQSIFGTAKINLEEVKRKLQSEQ